MICLACKREFTPPETKDGHPDEFCGVCLTEILVPVQCADGLTFVSHTPSEFQRLWQGVHTGVSRAMGGFNKPGRAA